MDVGARELGLAIAVLGLALPARADTCVKPDLVDTFPPDGAKRVPTNARLTAHYEPTAEYLDEDVRLVRGPSTPDAGADAGDSVPVTWSADEGLLVVTPPDGLLAGEHYVIRWPKLRGLGTASRGRGRDVAFTVGSDEDLTPPSFEGLVDIQWDVRRASDECTSSVEERFVFDVTPGKASDDSGTGSLAVIVYQTQGGDVGTDPGKPVLTAPLPSGARAVQVERPIAGAKGHVCFAAHIKDLTGKVSTGNGANKEVCVKTTPPPFFYGCTLGAAGAPRTTPDPRGHCGLLVFAALGLSLRRRRRHRAAP